jgi:hypothetical protein
VLLDHYKNGDGTNNAADVATAAGNARRGGGQQNCLSRVHEANDGEDGVPVRKDAVIVG